MAPNHSTSYRPHVSDDLIALVVAFAHKLIVEEKKNQIRWLKLKNEMDNGKHVEMKKLIRKECRCDSGYELKAKNIFHAMKRYYSNGDMEFLKGKEYKKEFLEIMLAQRVMPKDATNSDEDDAPCSSKQGGKKLAQVDSGKLAEIQDKLKLHENLINGLTGNTKKLDERMQLSETLLKDVMQTTHEVMKDINSSMKNMIDTLKGFESSVKNIGPQIEQATTSAVRKEMSAKDKYHSRYFQRR